METTTTTPADANSPQPVDVHALIPRQAGVPATGAASAPGVDHWLVRQLHAERERADSARRAALMGLVLPTS